MSTGSAAIREKSQVNQQHVAEQVLERMDAVFREIMGDDMLVMPYRGIGTQKIHFNISLPEETQWAQGTLLVRPAECRDEYSDMFLGALKLAARQQRIPMERLQNHSETIYAFRSVEDLAKVLDSMTNNKALKILGDSSHAIRGT